MKPILLLVLVLFVATIALSQANTTLSNLTSPIAINQSLVPNSNNARNLGSSSLAWKSFYLTGSIFKGSKRFLSNSGIGNTFLGIASGSSLTSGNSNTAIGDSALYASTSSYYNTAVGYMALTKTSGGSNAAIGWAALRDNTDGYNNTAIGYGAMMRNTTGHINVAIGTDALINNSSGVYNVAIGMFTLVNSNGNFNTAVGHNAMYYNGTGAYTTAVGESSLYNTRTAQYNTAIGYRAGYSYDNGYNNVFVGANTDVNNAGYYNVIAIGQATVCTAPSQVTMGNSATGSYRAYANWSNISDGRFKKNIKENVPGLAFINKLRPVTYTLDASGLDYFLNSSRTKDKQPNSEATAMMQKALKEKEAVVQTGFIAQEVEKAAKELNYGFDGVEAPKNEKDVYALKYGDFVVPLVKAVQELSKKNEELEKQNQQLEERLSKLEALLTSNSTNSAQALSSIQLAQNTPNPFSRTTTIRYTISSGVQNAQLLISDYSGKIIKSTPINSTGSGSITVDASFLSGGAYNYSIVAEGRTIATKKMIVSK